MTLLVVLGVAFAAYAGVSGLAVTVLPGWRLRTWAVLLAGFVPVVIGVYLYQGRPAAVYHDVFAEWPTPDVAIRDGRRSFWGDSGTVVMTFTAAPSTIARLRSRVPARPAATRPASGSKFGFASEEEELTYDPQTRVAVYTFTGID